jgi:hypothetical protein
MRYYVIPNLRIPLRINYLILTPPKHSRITVNVIIIHETAYFEALVTVNVHKGFIMLSFRTCWYQSSCMKHCRF